MSPKIELLAKVALELQKGPRKIPNDQFYRSSKCHNCSGENLFRYLLVNENRFRPNGVEIDRYDYFFYCWACQALFEDNEKWQTTYLVAKNPSEASEDTLEKLLKALESNCMLTELI